jgi:hypothetical protein
VQKDKLDKLEQRRKRDCRDLHGVLRDTHVGGDLILVIVEDAAGYQEFEILLGGDGRCSRHVD